MRRQTDSFQIIIYLKPIPGRVRSAKNCIYAALSSQAYPRRHGVSLASSISAANARHCHIIIDSVKTKRGIEFARGSIDNSISSRAGFVISR